MQLAQWKIFVQKSMSLINLNVTKPNHTAANVIYISTENNLNGPEKQASQFSFPDSW